MEALDAGLRRLVFCYTQVTVDIVQGAGFPADRITRLDDAIDTSSFRCDLARITDADVALARLALDIREGWPVGMLCSGLSGEALGVFGS